MVSGHTVAMRFHSVFGVRQIGGDWKEPQTSVPDIAFEYQNNRISRNDGEVYVNVVVLELRQGSQL